MSSILLAQFSFIFPTLLLQKTPHWTSLFVHNMQPTLGYCTTLPRMQNHLFAALQTYFGEWLSNVQSICTDVNIQLTGTALAILILGLSCWEMCPNPWSFVVQTFESSGIANSPFRMRVKVWSLKGFSCLACIVISYIVLCVIQGTKSDELLVNIIMSPCLIAISFAAANFAIWFDTSYDTEVWNSQIWKVFADTCRNV